ncbi:tRNA (adenosine(37)-N6)-threonylcarbamoyltransferase complex dimerization subunit type 1 TsaB [Undibacterium sp.]|uniref:tRNA (adenosine(37)-N6)-threonylcarbamoyltransferase complex dimerization subunit type 1 TsaB n=1 Tax=Undibacterium sp. TaxID=1914977 RepID=UPI0025EC8122|nr:tRNA (adenosine(37)-N6)-threonylcarbamoyltransferase complex dimerization subunit type 1 TsaB [Undibacterium sp.]
MTTLLAIETSTELASVALLNKGELSIRELTGVQTHSQGVLPAIQELLNAAGLSLSQCQAIAFGCGPGAFTGVRTTCGIVQGLAYGADLPILPIISLQAMAQAARDQDGDADFVCVLDARMTEVYWAHYRLRNQAWELVSEPALSALELALAYADAHASVLVLGNGLTAPAETGSMKIVFKMPHAAQVAQLAAVDFSDGKQVAPEMAQPVYLRNKIALTTIERMQLKNS